MKVYDAILKKDVEQIDENEAVRNLKRSSPEFNQFYHEERMKKLGEILWRVDPEIEKMRTITVEDRYGISYPIIYINDANISIDDTFIVGHEIMHCVLVEEGKSLKIFGTACEFANAKQSREFASAFQTMLEDSIVDSILLYKYKLGVLRQYNADLDLNKKENWIAEPKGQLARIYLAFRLSNNILKWRIIRDSEALDNWHSFLEKYRICYPIVSRISDEILSILDDIGGIETLEQKRSAFLKIIEKYNLEKILTINPPTQA